MFGLTRKREGSSKPMPSEQMKQTRKGWAGWRYAILTETGRLENEKCRIQS
jgi:hypothetical protein